MKTCFRQAAAAGLLLAGLAGSHGAAAQDRPIIIGVPGPMTGAEASYGDAMVKGAQIAVDEAAGMKVQLDVQDDACDPQTAVNATNKLVVDQVAMVVGFHCSGAALPSLPILHRAHIPVIVSQALHPAITQQGFQDVFRTISTSAQEAPVAANYMLDTWKAKSVFLVHDNTAIMKNLVTLAGSAVTDAGGKVLGLTAVTPHTTEFGVTVANIMAAKPDAVFLALYYSEGALVAKQLLAAGYAGHILSSDAGVDPGFMKLAGEDVAEKVVFITQPVTAQLPAAKAFIAAYMAKYHEAPGALSAYTYDAMKVALAVLNQTHSTDPKKLLPALKAYKAEGISGPIQFDSHGQVMAADFVALVVKNGEFVEP